MGTVTARAAAEADIEAIGAVARASGLGPRDSGADPDYVRHLLLHGQVAVSVVADAVTGFGATLPVGGTTMLCDLFVRPDAQDGGAGAALLELLFDGVDRRMTFASRDPRAMALYTRFRMAGRWVLFYLRATGAAGPAPAGTVCVPAGAAEVATLELAWTGIDRGADHRYWASRPGGHGFVVRRDGLPVATGSLAEARTARRSRTSRCRRTRIRWRRWSRRWPPRPNGRWCTCPASTRPYRCCSARDTGSRSTTCSWPTPGCRAGSGGRTRPGSAEHGSIAGS